MGNTPSQEQKDINLSLAAEKGEVIKVDQLLKDGADPNKPLKDGERLKRNSLHRAAKTKNNVDVLTKLLSYIKDVDATDDEGNTALHLAAGYYNNAAVVQTLLHAKPNCKIQNSKGQTALHSAVDRGSDWKVIECLLLADTDPNIADFNGNTALHLCAGKRSSDDMVPGILLRFGANPNIKNNEGQTALHVAAHAGNKVVLLLLKFHAKVRLRDKEGKKPADLAEVEEIKRILEFEERSLEERTFRSDYGSLLEFTPEKGFPFRYNVKGLEQRAGYCSNGVVTPNGKPTHFWAEDIQKWKACGGNGIIQLPDKSEIVVPPQAVPKGTVIKLSIKPSQEIDSTEHPQFDFRLYEFELNVKVDLPGAVLFPSGNEHKPSSFPPAFTGFCADGKNRWFSSREVACQRNGVTALQFNLQKKKGERIVCKIPTENKRSSTEVFMRTPKHHRQQNIMSTNENESVSSLSSQENAIHPIESLNRSASVSSRYSTSSKTSSSTEEEFIDFDPSNDQLASENAEEEVLSTNRFGHVQVEVGIHSLKSDKNNLQNKEGSKAIAVDKISDFLRQQVNLQADETSSDSSDDMEADLCNHKDLKPQVESQIDIVDAKKQYAAVDLLLNKNEIYEFDSQCDRPDQAQQRNLDKSSLNLDLLYDVHPKSIKNASNDDNNEDVRSKIEIEKDCFSRYINNSTKSNTQVEDTKNETTENLPEDISVNVLNKYVSNEKLALKPTLSSGSSSSSDEDEKNTHPKFQDDLIKQSSPVLKYEHSNIDKHHTSFQTYHQEYPVEQSEKVIENQKENNLCLSSTLAKDDLFENAAEKKTSDVDNLDENGLKRIRIMSPKTAFSHESSSSSSEEEQESTLKNVDKFQLTERPQNESRQNLTFQGISNDSKENVFDSTQQHSNLSIPAKADDFEKVEADPNPYLITVKKQDESNKDISEDNLIENLATDYNKNSSEEFLRSRDQMIRSNEQPKQDFVLSEDLDTVHELLLLQENSSEERLQHPIDPALATINEDIEEQILHPRLRHTSSSSSSDSSSTSTTSRSSSNEVPYIREKLI